MRGVAARRWLASRGLIPATRAVDSAQDFISERRLLTRSVDKR
jgi:hypothetical protein